MVSLTANSNTGNGDRTVVRHRFVDAIPHSSTADTRVEDRAAKFLLTKIVVESINGTQHTIEYSSFRF